MSVRRQVRTPSTVIQPAKGREEMPDDTPDIHAIRQELEELNRGAEKGMISLPPGTKTAKAGTSRTTGPSHPSSAICSRAMLDGEERARAGLRQGFLHRPLLPATRLPLRSRAASS